MWLFIAGFISGILAVVLLVVGAIALMGGYGSQYRHPPDSLDNTPDA